MLQSRKTQTVELRYYSKSKIKTEMKSNATNQTGLLITFSNKGMRKQQQEREKKTGKKET